MDTCTLCSDCKGFVIFDEMGFESNLFSKAQKLSDVRLTIPLIYENPLLFSSQNEDLIQKPHCDNNFWEAASTNCDGRDCTSSDSSLDNAKSFFRDLNSCFKTSNSFASSNSKQPPIDLELGRLVDDRGTHDKMRLKKDKDLSSSSVSASTKRTRTPNSNSQVSHCQVHGCNMDLSSSKEYHKRHRVCEVHSKTRIVIVNGMEQRFCQQCSRFHLLAEFDDGKRSCRRRLAGHNERRRKPVMDAHSTRFGKLLQAYRGSFVQDIPMPGTTSFFCPEMFPRGTLIDEKRKISNWLGSVKLEEFSNYNTHPEEPVIRQEQLLKSTLSHSMDKVFPQLQNDTGCTPFWSDSRSFPAFQSQNMTPLNNQSLDLYRNYTIKGESRISDPGCALSLLSDYSAESPLTSHEIQMDRLNQYNFSQSRDNLPETYRASRRIPSSGLKSISNDVKPCIHTMDLKDPMIQENGYTVDLLQMTSDFRNMENHDRDGFCYFPLA